MKIEPFSGLKTGEKKRIQFRVSAGCKETEEAAVFYSSDRHSEAADEQLMLD